MRGRPKFRSWLRSTKSTSLKQIRSVFGSRACLSASRPGAVGGDTIFVDVSAKTGAGIDSLLESLLLQAEVLESDCAEGSTR